MSSLDLTKREYPLESDSDTQINQNRCGGCNCERSQCLKMYCQCFAVGRYCNSCNCKSCNNLPGNKNLEMKVRELNKADNKYWHEAIEKEAIECNNSVTENNVQKSCHCTRSKCLKGYCDCFNAGRFCTEFCKCVGCCNKVESQDQG